MREQIEEKLLEFEEKINRGDFIEATDWMPDEYRKQLIRLIKMHANSELMGALPEGEWIPKAPSIKRKLQLVSKVQDEVGHAQMIYRVAEDLSGMTREQMLEELISGKAKFHNVFHYPAENWADVAIIAWLVDGAALVTQGALTQCSYAPYARIMKRICWEEAVHLKYGEEIVLELASGTKKQREMLQDALNRWWFPIMHFFGPPDEASTNTQTAMKWKIKIKTNDELRQEYLSRYVPLIREIGLEIPDPDLHYDEKTGKWITGDLRWDEFNKILNNDGPKTKPRLLLREHYYKKTSIIRELLA
ncbi:MAG: 1,2-phenylacetyl-CoA epoxidase subunit A [candidate division WOR-3 bacterium]|nr:1,2-phenylacetyl-CoA epoxidase subunit A [candidate division WOR-3 bacterium]MCX7948051.1 1,2-phenylacetyl-CoA epoxidase subunit A [candidate division WOR-3 bacterium]MDW8151011.1 1,2-phenylacetyl-CoA epoxidase subunit PaaA [candidate division WOR-3 bacterium]